MNIPLGPIKLQWNFVNVLLLLAFIFQLLTKTKSNKSNIQVAYKPILPFITYYFCLLLIIPFQAYVPTGFMINSWRIDVMTFLLVPFVMLNILNRQPSAIKLFRFVLILSIVVSIGYELFITTQPGANPYLMAIQVFNGLEFDEAYYTAREGRIFGRISSVFSHPMTFGLVLTLATIYFYFMKNYINKYISYFLFFLSIIGVFLCGIRTPIGAILLSFLFYLLLRRSFKLVIVFSFIGAVGYTIISTIPEISLAVGSIFNDKLSEDVGGASSISDRLNQFLGCIDELKDCWLFGKGYNWHAYYLSLHEIHPKILAFESLIFVVLCNGGLVGFLFYVREWTSYFKINQKTIHTKDDKLLVYTIGVGYITYTIITGDYGYLKFFMIFYVLMLGEIYYKSMTKTSEFK